MGYESKVYVTQKYDLGDCPYYETLAMFDLCKMGWDIYDGKMFRQLFDLPQDGHFFADDGNTILKEDCYGDPIEGADLDTVLKWLRKYVRKREYHRAICFLLYLDNLRYYNEGKPIICFHYGY